VLGEVSELVVTADGREVDCKVAAHVEEVILMLARAVRQLEGEREPDPVTLSRV
jgi:hypothetical protein